MNFLDGKTLKNMLIAGANELSANLKIVNELNVFPVPDGDTGFNMLKTLEGGIKNVNSFDNVTAGEVANAFASGSLLGARGNSGVILSQIFKGIGLGLNDVENASVKDLKNAFTLGVKSAYSSVQNPVEGTILTVFREATEFAVSTVSDNASIEEFFSAHITQASKTLIQTKEILPVLKESDVVDSGGAGYLYIIEGWYKMLTGEEIAVTFDTLEEETTVAVDLSLFSADDVLNYGYCTEFLLRLQNSKVNISTFDEKEIVKELENLGGDSIVACKTGDIVKIHVHICSPGQVLNLCQKYGEFLTLKIENMTLQHNEVKKKAPTKKVGVVTVASGDGIIELFENLGADAVINGGQTANPSTQDFINAFDKVNAKNILVFPNNSNVILTALQSAKMYSDSKIYVVNTKTIQEGYVALSLVNVEAEDLEEHIRDIEDTLCDVTCIDVTYAVRNSTVDGSSVIKGDFMGISGKRLISTARDKVVTAIKAIANTSNLKEKELLTIFIGADVSDSERDLLEGAIAENFPDLEYTPIEGGQEVYSFLIVLE